MKKHSCRTGFIIALLLTLTFTAQWTLKSHYWQLVFPDEPTGTLSEVILEAIPQQARIMVADACWLQADEYMHFGPSKRLPQIFIAGTYAGHTEMLPLLQLIVMLDPQHIDACVILVQTLCLHFKKFEEGIRTLQSVILANKNNPRLSELYGSGAHIMGFRNSYGPEANNRDAAIRYLNKALATWRPQQKNCEADPILTPTTYSTWKARFLVDKGQNKEALAVWQAAGLPLNDGSLLGKYLTMVAYGLDVPKSPEDLLEKPTEEQKEQNRLQIQKEQELEYQKELATRKTKEHEHHEECNHEEGECHHGIKPSPLQTGVLRISLQTQLFIFTFFIIIFGWLSRTGKQRR